jgi:hypothetical protein
MRGHRLVTLLLVGALAFATGADLAHARRKKQSVAATINGKHRRWRARKVHVVLNSGNVTVIATITRPRLHQLVPGLSIACQLDLAGPFPVTPQFPQLCVLGYSEFRFARNIPHKLWGGNNFDGSVTVTFDSLVDGKLTGTFRGTLPSEDMPPGPPAQVDDGTFVIDVGG